MNVANRVVLCVLVLLSAANRKAAGADRTTMVETSRLPTEGIAPQAATDSQGRLHLIYFKGDPSHGDIFYLRARALDNQKHPAVAINNKGQFVVAWAEGTGWNKGGSVAWQVFGKKGDPIEPQFGRVEGLPAWSMPAAFAHADGTFGIIF